ncbi:DUF2334 domain-containing protein [Brevibacillus laterosporus]|uniref:DUF2334 domain-containing protein n=1 Tax=Brevibacillus laterosporus TaxID=1465 RepID=UPI0014447C9E|nr:DUF2334 domain-containing protein [Brevibacillus laterosporus]NKQ20900.1 DUF2334 domain-containing protein [Brevibacillus laterosporus]WNX30736.1 DUF2334 domain-containing protein [Brevibacillus laterosporus]
MIWGRVQEKVKKSLVFLLIGIVTFSAFMDFASAKTSQENRQSGVTWLLYHQSDEYTTAKKELILMLSLFQEKIIPINIDQQIPPQASFDYLVYIGNGTRLNGFTKEWQQVIEQSHVPVYVIGGNPANFDPNTPYKPTGMIHDVNLLTVKSNRYPLDQVIDVPLLYVPFEKQSTITAFVNNGVKKAPYLLADQTGVKKRPLYYSAQFVGTGELGYAFVDSLYDFYQQKVIMGHSLHVYLEGITPTSYPQKLLTKARLLNDLGIPFSISLTPIAYEKQQGRSGTKLQQIDLRHFPNLVNVLLQIQHDLGGQIVVKGVTNTLQQDRFVNRKTNPMNRNESNFLETEKEILQELGISPVAVELPEWGLPMKQAMEVAPFVQQMIGVPDLGAEWPKFALSRPLEEQLSQKFTFYSKLPLSHTELGQYVACALQQVQASMIMRHTQMILPVPIDLPDAELKDLMLRLEKMQVLFYFLPEEKPVLPIQPHLNVDEQARVQKASFYISWGLVVVVSSVVLYFILEVGILRKKRAKRMFEESSKEVGGAE